MKQMKLSAVIVFFVAIIYCCISYGIFWYKKACIDRDLQMNSDEVHIEKKVSSEIVEEKKMQHSNQDKQDDVVIQSLVEKNAFDENQNSQSEYSFVSMPISDNYRFDLETQESFDRLIGDNVELFIKLLMQSNNRILGADACPECSVSALIKQVKQHKKIERDDIIILQKMIANLYTFIETTKKISGKILLHADQYAALQFLNLPQHIKNNIKIEERQAATVAILHKLKMMQYPDKQL